MRTLKFSALMVWMGAVLSGRCPAQTFSVETRNMRLLMYSPEHSYIAPHMTRCFENSLRFHRNLFDYTPTERITVTVEDFDDYGNAGASAIPWNHLAVGLEPYDYVYETGPSNERMNWVMNHELAHLVATDKSTSTDRLYRSIFLGKVEPTSDDPISMAYSFLTTPRWYSARWYHEGLAVFFETWMAGGIGRVLGGYDEMVWRTMVNDSSYFYDFVGIESEGKTIDFQVGAISYLYGTRFVSYLAHQYGPERLIQWINRTEGSDRYFASQFERVYGVPLDDEWSRWIAWEHAWQQANLDSIRRNPTTPYRKILPNALGSISRAYYDSARGCIYTAMNVPGHLANIVSINIHTGAAQKICDVTTPALYYVCSLAYDPSGDQLFFSTHNSRFWRGISRVDLKTGKTETLLRDARIGDLVLNPADKSLWGIQHHNGYSTLVRIPPPYTSWFNVIQLKYGKDLFDLDISPDGVYLAGSLIEISGKQTLVRFPIENLLRGDGTPELLIEFDNNTSPYNFVHSPDGKALYGTSYYSGVSNIYRLNLESKKLDAITNAETGFFRPLPFSADSLVVFRYTGKGFLPVMIANRESTDVSAVKYLGQEIVDQYPVLKTWTLGSPMEINADSLITSTGVYHGLGHLRLASMYPVVEGYKNTVAFGEHVSVRDPGGEHLFDLIASYSPNRSLSSDEMFHLAGTYYSGRWKVNAMVNGSDFYDLFGPTKTSRKGYSLALGYTDYALFDYPRTMRYSVNVAGFGGLEKLPDFQNISASYDKFLTAGARLEYSEIFKSLGAVDEEEGTKWNLNLASTLILEKFYPRFYGGFDRGFLLPLDHSSIWLRSSAGYSPGDRNEPSANFYFGGFGNNWVDHLSEKRYREYYSFPGTELNAIPGTDFGKLLVEWTLPPIRFRRFGFPAAYSNWSRFALFASGLVTNVASEEHRRSTWDVGVQTDWKLVMFSSLESTLSIGYAVAVESGQHFSREVMASLKILQ